MYPDTLCPKASLLRDLAPDDDFVAIGVFGCLGTVGRGPATGREYAVVCDEVYITSTPKQGPRLHLHKGDDGMVQMAGHRN